MVGQCGTKSQDICCKSVDVLRALLGNLYRVSQRCKDIQSDSGNRSLLISMESTRVHCQQLETEVEDGCMAVKIVVE